MQNLRSLIESLYELNRHPLLYKSYRSNVKGKLPMKKIVKRESFLSSPRILSLGLLIMGIVSALFISTHVLADELYDHFIPVLFSTAQQNIIDGAQTKSSCHNPENCFMEVLNPSDCFINSATPTAQQLTTTLGLNMDDQGIWFFAAYHMKIRAEQIAHRFVENLCLEQKGTPQHIRVKILKYSVDHENGADKTCT